MKKNIYNSTNDSQKTIETLFSKMKSDDVPFSNEQLRSVVESAESQSTDYSRLTRRKVINMSLLTCGLSLAVALSVWQPQFGSQSTHNLHDNYSSSINTSNLAVSNANSVPSTSTASQQVSVQESTGRESKVKDKVTKRAVVVAIDEKLDSQKNGSVVTHSTVLIEPENTISGAQFIELNTDEMKRLGLSINSDCALEYYEAMPDTAMRMTIKPDRGGASLHFISISSMPEWTHANEFFTPAMVTNARGELRLRFNPPNPLRQQQQGLEPNSSVRHDGDSKQIHIKIMRNTSTDGPESDKHVDASPRSPEQGSDKHSVQVTQIDTISMNSKTLHVELHEMTPEEAREDEARITQDRQQLLDKIHIGSVVGVRLRPSEQCKEGLVVWYDLSPSFIERLPLRYSAVLQSLYESTQQQQSNSNSHQTTVAPRSANDNGIAGCALLETCRQSTGAIDGSEVLTQPATSEIRLRFRLLEPRQCSFRLHYINGALAANLAQAENFEAGEHVATLQLRQIPSGMYLLSMTTPNGERIVQRVVVQ